MAIKLSEPAARVTASAASTAASISHA